MKPLRLVLSASITALVLISLSACTTGPDRKLHGAVNATADTPLHIRNIEVSHYGSSIAPLVGGLAAKWVVDSNSDENYQTKLNRMCLAEIKTALENSPTFSVTDTPSGYVLDLDIQYEIKANTVFAKSPVALQVTWKLYDETAKPVAEIETIVVAEQARERNPDTTDPVFMEDYTALAHKSATDFLTMLQGKEPVWGKESVLLVN